MIRIFSFWLLAVFLVCGAEAPSTFKVSALNFQRPPGWAWVEPTSSMRQAQLSVKGEGGEEEGEVVFFYFGPGSGGGTEANVKRWIGQFEGAAQNGSRSEAVTVGGRTVTYVEVRGIYQSGLPGGAKKPKPNFALLGAIIEDPAGSVFVRMTGPAALVKRAEKEFRGLVESGLKR